MSHWKLIRSLAYPVETYRVMLIDCFSLYSAHDQGLRACALKRREKERVCACETIDRKTMEVHITKLVGISRTADRRATPLV